LVIEIAAFPEGTLAEVDCKMCNLATIRVGGINVRAYIEEETFWEVMLCVAEEQILLCIEEVDEGISFLVVKIVAEIDEMPFSSLVFVKNGFF
jgi:hypothetical protein